MSKLNKAMVGAILLGAWLHYLLLTVTGVVNSILSVCVIGIVAYVGFYILEVFLERADTND